MENFVSNLIVKFIEWLLVALIVMFIWNSTLMDIFNTSRIGYWDSFMLVVFVHTIVPMRSVINIKDKE